MKRLTKQEIERKPSPPAICNIYGAAATDSSKPYFTVWNATQKIRIIAMRSAAVCSIRAVVGVDHDGSNIVFLSLSLHYLEAFSNRGDTVLASPPFDSKITLWRENEQTHALNFYGKLKHRCERKAGLLVC